MSKHLTMTILFQGRNLNYGESVGTVGTLKKHYRDGRVHTYLSRQAIRYSLIELLAAWDNTWKTALDTEGKTLQYSYDAVIKQCPELDLFGYMKTKTGKSKKVKGQTDDVEESTNRDETKLRTAPVRISDAVSLEAWSSETAFNNNMGLFNRDTKADAKGLIPYSYESHLSWYSYTVTIDLDRIGKDEQQNNDVVIEKAERAARINTFLDAIKCLYRDIRGRREDLSPMFVIGGVSATGNPLFYNLLKVEYKNSADVLNIEAIKSKLNLTLPPNGTPVKDSMRVGMIKGIFANEAEITQDLAVSDIETFFKNIKGDVDKVYADKA